MKRWNLATLALCVASVAAYAGPPIASEADMIKAVNAIRAQARTCPGGNTFPAAKPLVVNPLLSNAAATFAQKLNPMDLNKYMSLAGYLAFKGAGIWNGAANVYEAPAPDVNDYVVGGKTIPSAPKFWLTNQEACEAIMTPFTEAGVGVYAPAPEPGYATTWPRLAVIMASPFETTKVDTYTARMFAELNRIRSIGSSAVSGAVCTSGPVSPLKWNAKMAQAAQFHSNDYANAGLVASWTDGSPHTGTAGDSPNSRIQAAGCSAGGGENVSFNYGLTPEDAVRGWLRMSSGHCSNVFTQTSVGGFGIAGSAKLQNAYSGPFVTFNLGADTGCSASTAPPLISYDAHVQDTGWMPGTWDGGAAGTTGKSLRLEALKIRVQNPATGTGCRVYYQAHVQDIGWMPEVADGAIAGTTAQGKRLEALKVRLANCDQKYHVYYQAHVQDTGWMPEVSDGAVAGTTGQGKRIEAVKIRVAATP